MNKEQKWDVLYDYHPLYHKRKKMVYYAKHPDHYEVMFLGETLDEVERFVNVLKIISDVYDK
jgi:hypothetical protein